MLKEHASQITRGCPQPPMSKESAACHGLQGFNVVHEMLALVSTLKRRTTEELGNSAFAGISIVAARLLKKLPTTGEALESSAAAQKISRVVQNLNALVSVASMTAADAVTFRSSSLSMLLDKFGVHAAWKSTAVTGQKGIELPEWRINVQVRPHT